jgi:hypothetical protein
MNDIQGARKLIVHAVMARGAMDYGINLLDASIPSISAKRFHGLRMVPYFK